MLPVILFVAAGVSAHARGRRQASSDVTVRYEGNFPGGFTARRSIFADPRFQQGIEPNILRRYKHMEKLISFYDGSLQNITKYWTYGCWCFQMGDYPLRKGNGSPVDNVDKICKQHKECYQCAKRDAGPECNPEETGYRFSATIDPVTGSPTVQCTNPVGSCRRNICECDNAFASRLPGSASGSDGWTGAHHAHYGGFDTRTSCLARINTPGGKGHTVECCGTLPDRFPYRFAKDGTGKQCCDGTIFSSDTHQCCDGTVRSNGSC